MLNSIDDSFSTYITKCQTNNYHKKYSKLFYSFSTNIQTFPNIILYGTAGCGKYTQSLIIIENLSDYALNYIKKIIIPFSKKTYSIRISDIHYEVDFLILGHNSKLLWQEIFIQICDIIRCSNKKYGIIICKNFHNIHNELLSIFYSYIQEHIIDCIKIKFILLTENISFIPSNILETCITIGLSSVVNNKLIENDNYESSKINNLKMIEILNEIKTKTIIVEDSNMNTKICNVILSFILSKESIDFIKFRNSIYDIFIYNLEFSECLWYIVSYLIKIQYIKIEQLGNVNIEIYKFLSLYNNNYRFISHCEKIFYYLYLLDL